MTIAIYAGSFDPITNGHLDVIIRASNVFEKLYVGIGVNAGKNPLFTLEERMALAFRVTDVITNVEVVSFSGLLVEYAQEVGAKVIVRGLRVSSEFESELGMAHVNHKLCQGKIDTFFIPTRTDQSYVSSSTVKEIARFNGYVDTFVPAIVAGELHKKYFPEDVEESEKKALS